MQNKRVVHFPLSRLSACVCAVLVCALNTSAYANIITVTNTHDSGPGSLRQALPTPNGDTIQFDSLLNRRNIGLTTGELVIEQKHHYQRTRIESAGAITVFKYNLPYRACYAGRHRHRRWSHHQWW